MRPSIPFQSTPPRGGRRGSRWRCEARKKISIHAPARGATPPLPGDDQVGRDFNPRPREGGDDIRPARIGNFGISIHAPARGATTPFWYSCPMLWDFNPRPREGGDVPHGAAMSQYKDFNPRPREGGDAEPCWDDNIQEIFQSTPPRGGRPPTRR